MYRYGRSSNQTTFRSASPLSDDQILRHAPSVLADHPHESRGERYAFIPTRDVLQGLRNEGFQPFEVRQTRCRDKGKQEFTKHLVRLRHPLAVANDKGEVPEIILVNSHDGTSSYTIIGGIFRFVCSNGLIAGDVFNDVRVRHSGRVVDNVIEGSFRVIDDLKQITARVDEYRAVTLSKPEQLLLASAAQQVRWGEEHAPVQAGDLLRVRRFDDRKDDLWTTFNRVQENVMKGGLPGRTTTNRRTSTREVQGVNENVRLNRALWTLADQFAKLKNGEPVDVDFREPVTA